LRQQEKKYFFHSDGTPTFCLLDDHDDRGILIEEPELWRPIHMDDDMYMKKIEEAKSRADQMDGTNTIETPSPKTPPHECAKTSDQYEEQKETEYLSSVQCAHKQRAYTDLTVSPVQLSKHGRKDIYSVVDLVTPHAVIQSTNTEASFTGDKPHVASYLLMK